MSNVENIEIQPLSAAVGGRVTGIDLSQPLTDKLKQRLLDVWHEFGVICLPNQSLTEFQQVAFAETFGELALTQHEYVSGNGHPAIMYVTNEKENGEYIGALPDGEMFFHSDMCYVEKPSKATMLFAMHLPKEGGDTLFANQYRAYEALPEDVRREIAGLKAVNAYEPGTGATTKAARDVVKESPLRKEFVQPMVCTHPVTGRKALYVNRLMTESVVGQSKEESDELLKFLFDFQERPEFVYAHKWTVGDLLMWDNRCMLHARSNFDAGELRKLRRITVKGDVIA
jgi:taurine dioxygenase